MIGISLTLTVKCKDFIARAAFYFVISSVCFSFRRGRVFLVSPLDGPPGQSRRFPLPQAVGGVRYLGEISEEKNYLTAFATL